MRDFPTDPIQRHNLLIAAFCEDLRAGCKTMNGPNVSRHLEISIQINRTPRDGGGNASCGKPSPANK